MVWVGYQRLQSLTRPVHCNDAQHGDERVVILPLAPCYLLGTMGGRGSGRYVRGV